MKYSKKLRFVAFNENLKNMLGQILEKVVVWYFLVCFQVRRVPREGQGGQGEAREAREMPLYTIFGGPGPFRAGPRASEGRDGSRGLGSNLLSCFSYWCLQH